MTDDKLYTINEIAAMVRVTPQTVRSWIRNGKMGALKVHGSYRLTKVHLQEFLDRSNEMERDPIARAVVAEAADGGAVV